MSETTLESYRIRPRFIKKVESEDKSISGTVNLFDPPVQTNFVSSDYRNSHYLTVGEIVFRTEDKEQEARWEKFVELICIEKTAKIGTTTLETDLVIDFSTAALKAVDLLKRKMGLIE